MRRYVTKAWVADDCAFDQRELPPKIEIIASDGPIDTGLLDASGNPLYRVRDRIGFIKD